jgi:hypothetical protein
MVASKCSNEDPDQSRLGPRGGSGSDAADNGVLRGPARFADSVSELRGAGGVARCHDTQAYNTVVHAHNSRKS